MDILIVEDEQASRTALAEALQAHGHRVAVAADGREALLALSALPRPCAVVLDLAMPVMDGAALVRLLQLQGALDGVDLVALTASSTVPADLPFAAVLHKPLQLPALLAQLRALEEGPQPLRPPGGGAAAAAR